MASLSDRSAEPVIELGTEPVSEPAPESSTELVHEPGTQPGSMVTPGSCNVPIAAWPEHSLATPAAEDLPQATARSVVMGTVRKMLALLNESNFQAVADMFLPQSYWRDHLALSWQLQTVKGRESIGKFLTKCDGGKITELTLDESSAFRAPKSVNLDFDGNVPGIRAFLNFKTKTGSGRGVIFISRDDKWGHYLVWTMFLSLEELTGYEELINLRRPLGAEHGAVVGQESDKPSGGQERKTWAQKRREETDFTAGEPDVVIIGSGQAGLALAARLQTLGVPTLVIDRARRVGDNWRARYDTLVLHDPVWFDHMPYVKFPPTWPIFTPKDKMGDFLEGYSKLMDLNVWTGTSISTTPEWIQADGSWLLHVFRGDAPASQSRERILRPKHIVQATGHAGEPYVPKIPGIERFSGKAWHSSNPAVHDRAPKAKDGQKELEPWRVLIVGCCNSAHDIAQQMVARNCEVTMLQRSSTCVLGNAALLKHGLSPNFAEGGPPTEDADICLWGEPVEVAKAKHIQVAARQAQDDQATHQGLEKADFRIDHGPDEAGLFLKYLQRGGGYYIDVGGSKMIVDGKIRVKNGQVAQVEEKSVILEDGTVLEPDEIVFATGYDNMVSVTRKIFGEAVANRVGNIWGFDQDGEMRGMWRATGQQGLWMMGGNLAFCRYCSRILALQIKGQLVGMNEYKSATST